MTSAEIHFECMLQCESERTKLLIYTYCWLINDLATPLSIHFFVNFLPEERMISNKFKYATNTSMSLPFQSYASNFRSIVTVYNTKMYHFCYRFCLSICALQQVRNRSEFSLLSEQCIIYRISLLRTCIVQCNVQKQLKVESNLVTSPF